MGVWTHESCIVIFKAVLLLGWEKQWLLGCWIKRNEETKAEGSAWGKTMHEGTGIGRDCWPPFLLHGMLHCPASAVGDRHNAEGECWEAKMVYAWRRRAEVSAAKALSRSWGRVAEFQDSGTLAGQTNRQAVLDWRPIGWSHAGTGLAVALDWYLRTEVPGTVASQRDHLGLSCPT